jgi:hypothetical protein
MHGMGSALPGAERVVAPVPLSECLTWGEFAPRCDAEPLQPRQQGPPKLS